MPHVLRSSPWRLSSCLFPRALAALGVTLSVACATTSEPDAGAGPSDDAGGAGSVAAGAAGAGASAKGGASASGGGAAKGGQGSAAGASAGGAGKGGAGAGGAGAGAAGASGAGGAAAGGAGAGGAGKGGAGAGAAGAGAAGASAGAAGATGDCYAETYTTASLADLAQSYGPSKWLSSSLEALKRRHPDGHDLLVQMQGDSQLPEFADPSSWPNLMASVDTMCHEETHGWDFEHALSLSGKHAYRLRADLVLTAPKLAFFPRSELLSYIKDGSTAQYDETYLQGEQGTYDFVFLADELNAYITGLACAASVGDQIGGFGISLRDGAASHLLYLQWYLHRARTAHPALYAQMKASPEWMKVVRYQWARGHFWTKVASAYPPLGIDDAAIWSHINEPQNLSEIQQLTGEDPAAVACHP